MNGYLARWTGCCGTTRADLGSYSSMVIVCAAARPHASRAAKWIFMGLSIILQRQPRRFEPRLETLLAPRPGTGILNGQRAARHLERHAVISLAALVVLRQLFERRRAIE